MVAPTESTTEDLLEAVYRELGYNEGDLFNAVDFPTEGSPEYSHWVDVGDWLALAQLVGAERVFFVRNEPVLVFRRLISSEGEAAALNAYREAWCMSGPQCL